MCVYGSTHTPRGVYHFTQSAQILIAPKQKLQGVILGRMHKYDILILGKRAGSDTLIRCGVHRNSDPKQIY